MTCNADSTIFGCAISTFPWIIAGLLLIVAVLVALRLGLSLRERWFRQKQPELAPPARAPRNVAPGSPVQPPVAAKPEPPKPKTPPKPAPLQLRIADAPELTVADFSNAQAQGDFGELLTDIILTGDGWKKLESKYGAGGEGIDGLYVREVRGGGGFEALAVETKTNEATYKPDAMSDAKLEKSLSALYAQGAFGKSLNEAVANELIRALRAGPPFFRKELWRHNLTNGMTAITQLGANGEQKTSTLRSHARLIAGAYLALKQLDRAATYLGDKPVDEA